MKTRSIVALVATGIALVGVVPVVAQQAPASGPATNAEISGPATPMGKMSGPDRDGPGRGAMDRPGGMRGPAFLVAGCGDKAAERLEIALVKLSHRLKLTAEQKPLFEAFKTAALDAQTKLEETCKADAPQAPSDKQPDILAMLKSGLTVEQARLDAAKSVLPAFEALYNSLTDVQKAELMPHRGDFDAHSPGGKGFGKPGQFGGKGGHDGMNGQQLPPRN